MRQGVFCRRLKYSTVEDEEPGGKLRLTRSIRWSRGGIVEAIFQTTSLVSRVCCCAILGFLALAVLAAAVTVAGMLLALAGMIVSALLPLLLLGLCFWLTQYLVFESQPIARPWWRNFQRGLGRSCRSLAASSCRTAHWLLVRAGLLVEYLRGWAGRLAASAHAQVRNRVCADGEQPVMLALQRQCEIRATRGCRSLGAAAHRMIAGGRLVLKQLTGGGEFLARILESFGRPVGGILLETACGSAILGSLAALTKGNVPGRMQEEYVVCAILIGMVVGIGVGVANYWPSRARQQCSVA